MQTNSGPILRDLVLVGGGHSHVAVLKAFGMQPLAGLRITLVCTDAHTPYSGMLPGYVAGHYAYDEVHLDLVRLCAYAGARFVRAQVVGIDRETRQVLLHGRPPLDYDVLAINTGSTPQVAQVQGASEHAIAVKPIAAFNARWLKILARVRAGQGPRHIAVVGAGAGGVELLLAMQYRLGKECKALGLQAPQFALFSAAPHILPTHSAGVRARFMQTLQARGVQVHLGARVQALSPGGVQVLRTVNAGSSAHVAQHAEGTPANTHASASANANANLSASASSNPNATQASSPTPALKHIEADAVFWVTQAAGGSWLASTGLALDADGCVRVNAYLQSDTDARIFASGDVAAFGPRALEKAGVFAVRMGMPLARNLRQALCGLPLKAYRPQKHWLALISTGDRYAVASRGMLGFAGTWVWRWKDHIDRRFMQRFSDLGVATMAQVAADAGAQALAHFASLDAQERAQAQAAQAMRCGGCAAKVGAGVLGRALGGLQTLDSPDVLIGLSAPDDAALVRIPPGKAQVQTVDFFRAFIDDPYRFGQIAANHALGDIFAMGATPHTATAIAVVPPGLDRQTQSLLSQLMAGAVQVLNAAGCALVGGHSGEGPELSLGFAINGLVDMDAQGQPVQLMRKTGARAGDALILTKPLGTGTLFAAHALGRARGRWVEAALDSMAQSSQGAARTLAQFGARACTDVTGFGLLGHLVEMLQTERLGAQLELASLPLLDGALASMDAGIFSSLHSSNAQQGSAIAGWPGEMGKESGLSSNAGLGTSLDISSHPSAGAGAEAEAEVEARSAAARAVAARVTATLDADDPKLSAAQALRLRRELLFDPQTAGGLLASVPWEQAQACLQTLRAQGYAQSALIGRVCEVADFRAPISLVEQ
jgi:selenide,water dikinase